MLNTCSMAKRRLRMMGLPPNIVGLMVIRFNSWKGAWRFDYAPYTSEFFW
jgi:hypothetical protein